jgi:PST family polysaccharide transporter
MIAATTAFGIAGAGWAHVLVAALVILPAYLIALKLSGVRIGELARMAWLPTVATIPAVAAAIGATILISDPLLALLAGGGAALVVYAALVWPWLRKQVRVLRSSTVPAESGV